MKNKPKDTASRMISPEQLAAWTDINVLEPHSKVIIPTARGVEEAKEWVEDTEK